MISVEMTRSEPCCSGAEYLQIKYCEAVARREIIERDKARGGKCEGY